MQLARPTLLRSRLFLATRILSRSSDNDIALVQLSEPSSKPIVRLITNEVEGSLIPAGRRFEFRAGGDGFARLSVS